jgi:hypothetical protein
MAAISREKAPLILSGVILKLATLKLFLDIQKYRISSSERSCGIYLFPIFK